MKYNKCYKTLRLDTTSLIHRTLWRYIRFQKHLWRSMLQKTIENTISTICQPIDIDREIRNCVALMKRKKSRTTVKIWVECSTKLMEIWITYKQGLHKIWKVEIQHQQAHLTRNISQSNLSLWDRWLMILKSHFKALISRALLVVVPSDVSISQNFQLTNNSMPSRPSAKMCCLTHNKSKVLSTKEQLCLTNSIQI